MIQENQSLENQELPLYSQENVSENITNLNAELENEHSGLSLSQLLQRLESIVNHNDAGQFVKEFNKLRQEAIEQIQQQTEEKKESYLQDGNKEEDFQWEHPEQSKLAALYSIFKEKYEDYRRKTEQEQEQNRQNRLEIIERLKNLYTQSDAETNFFKGIREIKEAWANAGQVAKNEFKLLNNDYFHHLNQFYQLLDYKKEYLEQEYAHNLEKRKQIIARAKELETEPMVQKALNELQYLHKLWKEEAEPVAEEFRESTWEEFREISNRVHERKAEFFEKIEKEREANLRRKNEIIAELKSIVNSQKEGGHTFWQNSIKKVEQLREGFFAIGGVPKKMSSQNWTEFKGVLREFNTKKNNFYKNLKGSQTTNLQQKLQIIKVAKDNLNSEDWETAVPLFKKLQEDWQKIGHVPRSQADKIWAEFRDICNQFFQNYREKNNVEVDNWKENYKQKKALLEQLKQLGEEENIAEKLKQIREQWEAIGKVPKNQISINKEFNKVLSEKLKENNLSNFGLGNTYNEGSLADRARKIKNQIADLEVEVSTLENNLGFFANSSRENPLLKDTFSKIDEKKSQIETLKQDLHILISGE